MTLIPILNRKFITLVAISLAVGAVSSDALAQRVSKRTASAATRDVQQLMRMMDIDMNGTVSKDEVMNFMSQTFDRLDVNKSGTLEPNELRQTTLPNWLINRENPELNLGRGGSRLPR
jgi:Ca2+-binding EF-hand superfamily protein